MPIRCRELAEKIENMHPEADAQDIARLCLLLTTAVDDAGAPENGEFLEQAWRDTSMRLQAATDQHAAMTAELEALASSNPAEFSQDQIWVLIRAIKVQSQILQMYIGGPVLDV